MINPSCDHTSIQSFTCTRPGRIEARHLARWTRLGLLVLAAAIGLSAAMPAAASADGDVLRATLHNGLRVIIVRDPLAPVVTTELNYIVGSNEAPKGFPGMAHAQEHMMFRGSHGLSAGQLAAISAELGGRFDADTQQTVTQYFFTVPAADLDVALHIHATRMKGVLDNEGLWAQERGAIEQEVAQDLSNPEYIFYTKLLATMFKGTPYAHDALGTRPSFNKTTGAMLKRFHDSWYAPNNAILVVAGDVDPPKTLAEIKKLFEAIPSKKLPPRPAVHLQPVKEQTMTLKTDSPYGLAVIAFRMPGYDSPDYAAAQVMADALSSQRGDLYALVPEGKALGAEFSYDPMPQVGLGYAVAEFPAGGDAQKLVADMQAVLKKELKNGIPADLVRSSQGHEVADTELQKNSVSGLASEWSDTVAVEGHRSPAADVQAIRNVTAADVQAVARKYLDMDHAVVAVLTPQPSGAPVSSKSFGGKESFSPKQAKPVALPAWASKELHRLSVPTSTVRPVTSVLPNGLRLIVVPESVSDTVSVYGHVKSRADVETPKGQEGVDSVLENLFSFGTTSRDRLAFQKALDAIAANESAGTDFSLQVLTDHFDEGVKLLADNELHPALPKAAFGIVRGQVAAGSKGVLASPSFLTHQALKKGLFPKDDPTLRHPTPASVKALTLDDVKHYYGLVFRPDLTTIVVIGKVDPGQAKKVVARYFGGWKAAGPKPNTLLPSVPANKPAVTAVPDSSRVQDNVILAQSLRLTRTDADYYPLELGNHVLGGAFYATWLYRDLRERTGLVYYVGSDFDVGQTRGVYSVTYACDPPNVGKARAIIVQDLKRMAHAPVDDEDLHRAKALALRQIPLSESSADDIAGGLIYRVTHELPLDEPIRAAHRYMKLTAGDVQAAFAKWIRPEDLVQVTEGPSPQ